MIDDALVADESEIIGLSTTAERRAVVAQTGVEPSDDFTIDHCPVEGR